MELTEWLPSHFAFEDWISHLPHVCLGRRKFWIFHSLFSGDLWQEAAEEAASDQHDEGTKFLALILDILDEVQRRHATSREKVIWHRISSSLTHIPGSNISEHIGWWWCEFISGDPDPALQSSVPKALATWGCEGWKCVHTGGFSVSSWYCWYS